MSRPASAPGMLAASTSSSLSLPSSVFSSHLSAHTPQLPVPWSFEPSRDLCGLPATRLRHQHLRPRFSRAPPIPLAETTCPAIYRRLFDHSTSLFRSIRSSDHSLSSATSTGWSSVYRSTHISHPPATRELLTARSRSAPISMVCSPLSSASRPSIRVRSSVDLLSSERGRFS